MSKSSAPAGHAERTATVLDVNQELHDNEEDDGSYTRHQNPRCRGWHRDNNGPCCDCVNCTAASHAYDCDRAAQARRPGSVTVGLVEFPQRLWLGQVRGDQLLHVFVTEDDAAAWASISPSGPPRYVLPLKIDPKTAMLMGRTVPAVHELYDPADTVLGKSTR